MIRIASVSDTEKILDIWLEASIESHGFVRRSFWEAKLDDMRTIYLPTSENYVYDDGSVRGFLALKNALLAAIFVSPASQGKGVGRALMSEAIRLRGRLSLSVYEENQRAVGFYETFGFETVEKREDRETGRIELVMAN